MLATSNIFDRLSKYNDVFKQFGSEFNVRTSEHAGTNNKHLLSILIEHLKKIDKQNRYCYLKTELHHNTLDMNISFEVKPNEKYNSRKTFPKKFKKRILKREAFWYETRSMHLSFDFYSFVISCDYLV